MRLINYIAAYALLYIRKLPLIECPYQVSYMLKEITAAKD